ncbi:MAG: response regulator transcription factor [Synechococcaceae cyanobacterium]|nr:response regulator transcription factor [Synechococcaceae cyanobacterium]
MSGPAVLLLGPEAERLLPRLRLSGYRPRPDPDGSGDRQALPEPPAAVVLSPGCAGRIAELRGRYGAVPLLLGIPHDTVEGRARCLASGADDFWLTRRGPSDLLLRLRLQLGLARPAPPPEELLQLADLRVWPGRRRVLRGERTVELSGREYDLLLLLRHRGRVLSRERIRGAIWSEAAGAASNVIEVYVRYLRRKLEAGGERRLLHTVRGRGYCLAERMPPGRGEP